MKKGIIKVSLLGSCSCLVAVSSVAMAQDTGVYPADSAAVTGSGSLEEITVIGEKREVRLQDAPLAITAIGGDAMAARNMNEVNDLNGYVPGLTIAKEEGGFRIVSIRGIGYESHQNPNSMPGVAFHIDGVYIAHPMALAQNLLDVDHVEVLRGPQGTVFGQTSTGGAINVVPRQPVIGETSGTVSASYGNYNYAKAAGTVNLGISDTLAFRGSVEYLHHDGYGKSVSVPNMDEYDLDDANDLGARASLLFQPTDRFSAKLSGQIFSARRNAELRKNVDDPIDDPRTVSQDYPGYFDIDTRMIDLQLSYDLGDSVVLKSITAYQYMNKDQTIDNDGLDDPDYYVNNVYWVDRSKAFTQEVSISSQPGALIEWTAGMFYMYQRGLKDMVQVGSAGTNSNEEYSNVTFAQYAPFQHRSIAGYAQATAHATDQLSIIGGIRYSWDKIWAQPVNNFNVGGTAPRDVTSDAWTGKLSAQYQLTPENMVYLTGSRGYKPAAINFNSAPVFVPGYAEGETVWSAEVGTKNDFFDRTVRLNASAYYYWYDNFQYTAEDPRPFNSGTANLPDVRIYGVEFEGSLLPMQGLRFDGNLSLAKGKINSDYQTLDGFSAIQLRQEAALALGLPQPYQSGYAFNPDVIAYVAANTANVNGNKVPKLPSVKGTFSGEYAFDVGPGELSLRGEMIYRGGFNARIFSTTDLDKVGAYTIYNAFLRFEPYDEDYTISVSALNLTNKAGVNSVYTDPFGAGTTTRQFINPRQVFATVKVNF